MDLNFHNENDPFAAAWLRELSRLDLIAKGEVDERSIEELQSFYLRKFTQCHFFAGIGGWSHALRLAGWPDHRPVWTGSCPCQPFSQAGKRKGTADERHLWPAWFRLIEQCRPRVIFGEQVAGPDSLAWFDTVSSDLEGEGYTIGAIIVPVCGIGAPHKRERLFFVADSLPTGRTERRAKPGSGSPAGLRGAGTLADSDANGRGTTGPGIAKPEKRDPESRGRKGHADRAGLARRSREPENNDSEFPAAERTGAPVSGFWSNADWISCRDGKYRAIEPGVFPLAHGVPARLGRLRGYGNAIVPELAAEVIRAYMEIRGIRPVTSVPRPRP